MEGLRYIFGVGAMEETVWEFIDGGLAIKVVTSKAFSYPFSGTLCNP